VLLLAAAGASADDDDDDAPSVLGDGESLLLTAGLLLAPPLKSVAYQPPPFS
jgi:hypothetical protein